MNELEQILRQQAERYPKLQPADAVKLIFQNEFGGGHLIQDEESCLAYLRREYGSVEKDGTVPLYEEIGNGIVRVNLAAVKEEALEQLGKRFIRSAAAHRGSLDSFFQKLTVLQRLTAEGIFPFGVEELDTYLAEYKKAGCPAVSHSRQYREAYQPAYRIVEKWTGLSGKEQY